MFANYQIIDLTHPLHEKVPTWTGSCGFSLAIKKDYSEGLRAMTYRCHAGVGTHMDAPSHFVPGGKSIHEIELVKCVAPICKISLDLDPKARVTKLHLLEFEQKYGEILPGGLVVASSGWGKFWDDPDRYRNVDEQGHMQFPGFTEESVKLLLERGIVGIGIDTLSPETGCDGFPVHELVLGSGCYILENLANLERLPPIGSWAVVLPLCIQEATEAGVRAIAFVPKI